MDILFFKTAFMIFWISCFVIRYPNAQQNKQNVIVDNQKSLLEKTVLFGTLLGMLVLPVIYVFTPLLDFANYELPPFLNILALLLALPTLWLFYRSHKDLGQNWSATLEIHQKHTLVTRGVYTHIRHPMYTAIGFWVLIQAFLLPNSIGGLAGILSFGVLYFFRVEKEEAMMLRQFGSQYEAYKSRTNRLFPKLFS